MKDTIFKMMGQKSPNGKIILMAVVNEDFFNEDLPDIFELQCVNQAPTIYTGIYPNIRIIMDSIKDRTDDRKGSGVSGILLQEQWYCVNKQKEDIYGISIEDNS